MATKKKKAKANSKSEALRQMREGAPVGENQPSKKELKKQAAEEKKRQAKEAKEAQKAEAKRQREEKKAAAKVEREQKAAQRKAEREAKKKPKTGALTIEQIPYLPKGANAPLPELNEDQRVKLADEGDKEIRQLSGRFIRAAIIFRGYMHYELWKDALNPDTGKRGFKSIEKWAESAMPLISRSERFKIIKAAEILVPHIPEEELTKMTARNAQLLLQVPRPKLEDPEIIKAAKGSEKGLRKTLAKKAPEANIEESEHVFVPKTVKKNLDEAIAAIMALHELGDRGEALEGLGEYFMQGQTENPNFAGMSNREAYEQLQAQQDGDGEPEDVEEVHASGE